jgi:hypothetical protein
LPAFWKHFSICVSPFIIPISVSFLYVLQILKGILEGASHILPALRVLSNLLASCSNSVPLYSFCREAGLPGLLLNLLRHSQESKSIQQVCTSPRASSNQQKVLFLGPLSFELPSLFGLTALLFSFLFFLITRPSFDNFNASGKIGSVKSVKQAKCATI